jgi:hypothetical protein
VTHHAAVAPLLALVVVAAACRGGGSSDHVASAKGTIGGKSISVVTKSEIDDALKKLGHGVVESGTYQRSATLEAFEVGIPASEYGATSYVAIVRPAPVVDASPTDGPASAFEQAGYYAKLGCPTYLEDEALVAVCVEGRPAEARALLDKLVWH